MSTDNKNPTTAELLLTILDQRDQDKQRIKNVPDYYERAIIKGGILMCDSIIYAALDIQNPEEYNNLTSEQIADRIREKF